MHNTPEQMNTTDKTAKNAITKDDIINQLFDSESIFIRAVLSNPVASSIVDKKDSDTYRKVILRPAGNRFLMESFTQKQAFQKSLDKSEATSFLSENCATVYLQTLLETQDFTYTILANKKGSISILKKPTDKQGNDKQRSVAVQPAISAITQYNRVKNYIIPEGEPVPFLVYLGVMTTQGRVIASKYDKFKQINRFLEYIDDILEDVLNKSDIFQDEKQLRPLCVADFGCGKSYLTFAVHYFLTKIKGLSVQIEGLDLKKDVIELCNSLSLQFHCEGLVFKEGDIACYSGIDPDIVITLHACDTATDYALEYAVKRNAKAILSVPCCQHEVNSQISLSDVQDAFKPLVKYGIIKERFSSLVTDALRAEKLEQMGYKVQLLEFIDMTHTPKNILIRAVKRGETKIPSSEVQSELLCKALNINPTIKNLL